MDELEPLRHEAIRALSAAVAAERLPIEQFESRLALVRQAPNRATLDAIVAEALPSGGYAPPAGLPAISADHTAVLRAGAMAPVAPADVLRIATIFSSSKRAGSWTVPLRLELEVVAGELTIDLRDAVFSSDVLDIDLHARLSSVTLIVPAGAQVENECEERFSSVTHSVRSARGAHPIGLLIRLTGRVVLSSTEVKEKPPSGAEGEVPIWRRLMGRGG
ncbi:MAG TPA: hypothetical protein VGQ17_07210 [Gemmatimonadales bacterium]|jgi:hypothetical protein|nr:hypothetical protein [Gemmatimonadales bacterium]